MSQPTPGPVGHECTEEPTSIKNTGKGAGGAEPLPGEGDTVSPAEVHHNPKLSPENPGMGGWNPVGS